MKVDIDYGFSCGRAWISINGKVIAQTPGDDVYVPDEYIKQIIDNILAPLEESK